MTPDPKETLRAWLPHVLMITAVILAVWLFVSVVYPLIEVLLLAAGLALLTAPVIFEPVNNLIRWAVPWLDLATRRYIAGVSATVLLVAVVLAPVGVLLVDIFGSPRVAVETVVGVAQQDEADILVLSDAVEHQLVTIEEMFPRLQFEEALMARQLRTYLAQATDLNTTFMSFLFQGTSRVAELVLAIIALSFFYAQGPMLLRGFLDISPLTPDQQESLQRRHRGIVLRLLTDTVATAVVQGLMLALVITVVDAWLGSGRFDFLLVALVASFISLLPVVGTTVVWLPVAALFYDNGDYLGAILIAVGANAGAFAITWLGNSVGNRLDQKSEWMSFLLFIGLVGGILSFGFRGFVIGPMAVVFIMSISTFWLPLYGIGEATDDDEDLPHTLIFRKDSPLAALFQDEYEDEQRSSSPNAAHASATNQPPTSASEPEDPDLEPSEAVAASGEAIAPEREARPTSEDATDDPHASAASESDGGERTGP